MPINVALLGSGIFAQQAYLPSLLANSKDVTLHSIWSRSSGSAKKLFDAAKQLGLPSEIQLHHGDDGLSKVLDDKEVDAVILVLPITAQPALIIKALEKGKHVLSEKPVGKDVATARALIEEYEKRFKPSGLIWRVAENWAHEPMLLKAGEVLRTNKALGPVLYYENRMEGYVLDASPYHATTWRTIPDYQGGFLLDGGVHVTSALRTVLPTPPKSVVGISALHRTHLPPHDTLTGILLPPKDSASEAHGPETTVETGKTNADLAVPIGKSSAQGHIFLGFGAPDVPPEHRIPAGLTVSCLNGMVTVRQEGKPRKWTVNVIGAKGSDVKDESWSEEGKGVEVEVGMFARAVAAQKAGKENEEPNYAEPRGALWDLAVIEALLISEGKEVDLEKLIAGK